MDFALSPEQSSAVDAAREVVRAVLPELPEEPERFARAAHEALAERGFFGLPSVLDAALAVMELSAASPPLGVVGLTGWLFRRGIGPESARGIGCVLLGSNPAFTLRDAGKARVLAGKSPLVPLAPIASEALLRVQSAGTPVLVRTALTGFSLGANEALDALSLGRAPWGRVSADGVAVSRDAIVEGNGAVPLAGALEDAQNVLVAALAAGVARRAFTLGVGQLRGRSFSQNTEFSASDMAVDVDAAVLATERAAWSCDQGSSHPLESSAAKIFAAAAATRIAHRALSISAASDDATELRRCYLDAQFLELFGGTEAEHEDRIASVLLGES